MMRLRLRHPHKTRRQQAWAVLGKLRQNHLVLRKQAGVPTCGELVHHEQQGCLTVRDTLILRASYGNARDIMDFISEMPIFSWSCR